MLKGAGNNPFVKFQIGELEAAFSMSSYSYRKAA